MRFGSLGEPRETGKVVVADHFAEPNDATHDGWTASHPMIHGTDRLAL